MKKIFITLAIICAATFLYAQNLGIGTTNPNEKVHIEGAGSQTLKLQATSGSPAMELVRGTGAFGSGDWRIKNSGGDLEFTANTNQFLTLRPHGDVFLDGKLKIGSGTNSPRGELDLVATSPILSAEATNNGSGLQIRIHGQPSGTSTLFRVINGISNTKFTVRANGYVTVSDQLGVNKYDPDARFSVQGKTSDDEIFLVRRSNGAGGFYVEELSSGAAKTTSWGDMHVQGTLSKNGGSFKIDHPQDPANKYLYHSFVESPDMMNVYNGNITTDAQGMAVITLPEYFETLNRDFRYQLTCIGTFAQAIVLEEVAGNQFKIQTTDPNVKVSWQVTGIRQDPWANAHRIPNAIEKPEEEKGRYLNPELYGQPESKSLNYDGEGSK